MKAFTALVVALLLAGCSLFTGPDLKSRAQQDVQEARATGRVLTITPNGAGSTFPSGTVNLKDGFSIDIEGTAQPEQVLIGWKQSAGSGVVAFSPLSTTKMHVTLSGGDATIDPVYEARPVVLYMTPIGNSIAKNSSVRLVFNREVDVGNEPTSPLFSIKKQGVVDVPYAIGFKAGTTSVSFKPQVASLDDYSQYVVTLRAGIVAKLVFDSAHYPGVTFLNTTVAARSDYTNPFQTGATFDTLPPYGGSFSLSSASGNPFYGPDNAVNLNKIEAFDDSGDGGVLYLAVRNEADAFPEFAADSTPFLFDMTLPWVLKANVEGQYSVGVVFQDQNGNSVPATSATSRTFAIDKTPPKVNSFTLASPTFPGYISSLNDTFTLGAQDPPISGTSLLGSGESTDGSLPSEQKQYRLSNDGVTWSEWAAFTSSGSVTLASGPDGARSVQGAGQRRRRQCLSGFERFGFRG